MCKQINKEWEVYSKLDLYGGKLKTIIDDDEDMLTVTYKNGVKIDVGYIKALNAYFITVVKDDSLEGWNSPISVVEVRDKAALAGALQDIIIKIQSYIIPPKKRR